MLARTAASIHETKGKLVTRHQSSMCLFYLADVENPRGKKKEAGEIGIGIDVQSTS